MTSPAILSLERKVLAGKQFNINRQELRAWDQAHHTSYERELEMAVDHAVSHVTGLAVQFFTDGQGPMRGYEGAIACLDAYVGDPAAPLLTQPLVDDLRAVWRSITDNIAKEAVAV